MHPGLRRESDRAGWCWLWTKASGGWGRRPGPTAITHPCRHHHHTYGGKGFWATWHLSALQAPWAEAFLGYGWGIESFGVLHGGERPPRGGPGGSRGASGIESHWVLFALLLGGGFQFRGGHHSGSGWGWAEVTPSTPWARSPRFTAPRVLASLTGQPGVRRRQTGPGQGQGHVLEDEGKMPPMTPEQS